MKALFVLCVVVALASCGGGGSDPQTNGLVAYGFSSEGKAFVAHIDEAALSYRYSELSLVDGTEQASKPVPISRLASQPNTYTIGEHKEHLLGINASHVIASVKSAGASLELPIPAVFSTKPVTEFAQLAGAYKSRREVGDVVWQVDANGRGTLTCESNSTGVFNTCPREFSGTLQLEKLAHPYFGAIANTQQLDEQGNRLYLQSRVAVIFTRKADGTTLLHMGAVDARVCDSSWTECNSNYSFLPRMSFLLAENQGAKSPPKWTGAWVFNREGGKAAVLTIADNNTRSSAEPSAILATAVRNPAWTPDSDSIDIPATISKLPSQMTESHLGLSRPGESWLTNLGFGVASEQSRFGSSALVREQLVSRDVLRVQSDGMTKLFKLPNSIEWDERFIQGTEQVEIQVLDATGNLVRTTPLQRFVDYVFEPFGGRLLLSWQVPSVDESGNKVFIVMTVKLSAEGVRPYPQSFSLRLD